MLMEEERYLTADEAARELGLSSPDFCYRLLRAGTIRGELIDGRWRVPAREIELRKARVSRKRSSVSYLERSTKRSKATDAFRPLAGTPGGSA